MNENMTVQEAVEDVNEIELSNGKLYLCDERGWIVGKSVAVQP
jgi:hypothetical protein